MLKKSKKTLLRLFMLILLLFVAFTIDNLCKFEIKATESYLAGDINGDGYVNGKDITRLSKFLSGENVYVAEDCIDVNKDGSVSNQDIAYLMRFISGELSALPENVYHSIRYHDDITDYNDITEYYLESSGLSELPELSARGRMFKGWSTKPNDVKFEFIIGSIPKGSKENYDLYACWDNVKYTITYRYKEDDIEPYVKNTNVTEYTIDDEFEFSNPELSGLRFSHWSVTSKPTTGKLDTYTDSTNSNRLKLIKGTTGNIELTANWKSYENLVVPKNENRNVAADYDQDNNLYYFIYELGTIENVVLDSQKNDHIHAKTNNNPATLRVSETISIEESRAETISNTIAESITKSSDWSETNQSATTVSTKFGAELTTGFESGVELFKEKMELSFNFEFGQEDSWSQTSVIGGGIDEGSETTEAISSTITYRKELSTTNEIEQTIKEDAPLGNYYFVHAGNIKIYAFVIYKPGEQKMYLDTYSVLDNTHSILLYEPFGYNNFETSSISYDINISDIEERIESAYYVKYDANTGNGNMKLSLFNNNEKNQFSENNFYKTGYSHSGWLIHTSDGDKIYTSSDLISETLSEPGCTITAYAQWTANPYTVTLDTTGGTLTNDKYNVTYDSEYGNLPIPVRNGYEFTGWKLNDIPVEHDTVVTTAHDHTLTASWKANVYNVIYNLNTEKIHDTPKCDKSTDSVIFDSDNVELEVPYCDIYSFQGWYTEADGGEIVSDVEGKVSKWKLYDTDENGNIQLYARWSTDYTFIEDRAGLENIKNDLTGNYALISDIDISDSNWTALGEFSGTLDGNGYKIIGFTRSKTHVSDNGINYGFFSKLFNATIRDINFTDVNIVLENLGQTSESSYNLGIITGVANRSLLSDISVYGSIRFQGEYGGGAHVGGIVGITSCSKFIRCTNNSNVYAAKGSAKAGGIAGTTGFVFPNGFDFDDISNYLKNSVPTEFVSCVNNGIIEARLMVWKGYAYAAGIVGKDSIGDSLFSADCCNNGSAIPKDNGSGGGTYESDDIRNT